MTKLRTTVKVKSTAEVKVPEKLVDMVIGQEKAVKIIKKASRQKRNVLLIGIPGTGKSMLAQAMSELVPITELKDILIYSNPEDENVPKVRTVKAGEGRKILGQERMKAPTNNFNLIVILFLFLSSFFLLSFGREQWGDVITAALLIGLFVASGIIAIGMQLGRSRMFSEVVGPKLLIDNSEKQKAPFVEATGARAGSLLGDVRHDPFQCIPAGQLVHLPSGKPIAIEKLVDGLLEEGERELTEKETFKVLGGLDADFGYSETNVVRVFKRKYDGELLKIKTKRGLEITVTPNHPLAFLNENGGIEYKNAADAQKGSFAVVPDRFGITAGQEIPMQRLVLYADILADGSVGQRSVEFKLRKQFKIDEITKNIQANGFTPRVLKRGENTRIYINSSAFVKELREIGLETRDGKRIPECVFLLPKDKILAFVSRYLSLDGYVGSQGQFELISKELIPDFIPLLLKLGIKAKYRERPDPGFGKGKIQPRIIFADYDFAAAYAIQTINPKHKASLDRYLQAVRGTHVAFHDVLPVTFEFLEKIRVKTGLSKNKVHEAYYSMNENVSTHTRPTRGFMKQVLESFSTHANDALFFKFRNIVQGTYAYDEIESIEKTRYEGFVYNLTTKTGNYLVNNILTHNSGGLGTPAHLRVEAGFVHKSNGGVLFIDEVSALSPRSQQELLTAMQEKKYPITGQSELSSGAQVRTEPVPCDFVLVAAGNYRDLQKMHPALRSRIRGYGYEVYMEDSIEDSKENEDKLVQFIAQEIVKDGKIPHFDSSAIEEIVYEARKRSGRKNKLTLKLRDLGGLVRAAGDVAAEEGAALVSANHVLKAKIIAQTLEQQMAFQAVEFRKEYQVFTTHGAQVGKVNGLAVMGDAGVVLPIVAEVAPASSRDEAKIIATGKLGDIAKEAVENVSAIIKRHTGKDTSNFDIHIQFLQTYEGVEGDSASVSVATAVISALEEVAVKQDIALTGSLSVRGAVLPVGGITPKIEAAIDAGLKKAVIPYANKDDVILSDEKLKKIEILPAKDIYDVLNYALKEGKKKNKLLSQIKKEIA
jgi:Lon-like ATP-dependent protease